MEVPKPIKILIVDDDQMFNRNVEMRLNKAGFLTDSALGGEEALEKLKAKSFDLVVLDLIMPGLTGFDVLREMQKKTPPVRIAVLSTMQQEEDIGRTKELGASEYFVKSSPTFMDDIVKYAEHLSVS